MNTFITNSTHSIVQKISKYLDMAFPIFFLLMAVSFYLRTYDSAMIKITELYMFGTVLVTLWICKMFESGHWPFKMKQTLLVLPFLSFLAMGTLSFIRSPLPWGSFDFFVRRVIYIGLAMIAVSEMTSLNDFKRMTRWLVLAVAITTIYGLIQWLDVNFFPAGPPTVGLDKFVWRHAFGPRVFSTFGNPNFYSNFLVIMFPIMLALYLKDKKFFYLPLLFLTLANIYWTGSKGPVVGLIGGISVFGFLLIRFFVQSKKIKIAVFSTALCIVLFLGGFIINRVFYAGHITSFTFRMYTWLSTWEMINANPILGNGIGSFWVIYPAYRRPAIFHIEGKHNTETDHAENEHLEVWMDEGIVGMGLWIFMIFMITFGMYQALKILTAQPTRAGPSQPFQFPEETYYILGFLSGFLGMLIHNNTDVSMRFVSSGTPFWLLAGMNVALIMYSPMPIANISSKNEKDFFIDKDSQNLRYYGVLFFKFITLVTICIVAVRIVREFDWCQGRDGILNPNEAPHFIITWAIFLICWGSSVFWFSKIAFQSWKLKTLCSILIGSLLMIPFWGFFIGDTNHNRAIFFSKQGIWMRSSEFDGRVLNFPAEYQIMYSGLQKGTLSKNSFVGKIVNTIFPDVFWRQEGIGGALEHYKEVNRLRPDFIMAHYFRGNVYNDWGGQFAQKSFDFFQRGDIAEGEVFRKKTDEFWNLSLDAYNSTRKLGPNYVQMHHQVGTVHQKWGDYFNNLAPLAERYGKKDLAQEYKKEAFAHWHEALKYYELYYKIDPVFDQNFYRQAQIYIQLGEIDKAEQVYLDHIDGKECKKPYHQIFGGLYVKSFSTNTNRYDLASPEHTHDTARYPKPEVWVILGDFYSFVKNSPPKAEAAYRKAVQLFPDNIDYQKRLAAFLGRQNRSADAIKVWQIIRQLNPNDPDIQNILRSQANLKHS